MSVDDFLIIIGFIMFVVGCRNFTTAKFISKVVSVLDTGNSEAINSEKIPNFSMNREQ
jgi:hypothetical protein